MSSFLFGTSRPPPRRNTTGSSFLITVRLVCHAGVIPKPDGIAAPGCKRIIVDPDYLSCLNRRNVSLNWESVDGIVENGIRMRSGEVIDFDVIIFGTGSSLDTTDITTQGRNGLTVNEWYATRDGPTSYKGTCIPGYPNFFTLLGTSPG